MGNRNNKPSCYHKLNLLPSVRQWVAWRDGSQDILVSLCSSFSLFSSGVGSSLGWSPLGVCLFCYGAPPLTLVFPPSLPFQCFCPFLAYVFTAASPDWLMGLSVGCGGSIAQAAGPAVFSMGQSLSHSHRGHPGSPLTTKTLPPTPNTDFKPAKHVRLSLIIDISSFLQRLFRLLVLTIAVLSLLSSVFVNLIFVVYT